MHQAARGPWVAVMCCYGGFVLDPEDAEKVCDLDEQAGPDDFEARVWAEIGDAVPTEITVCRDGALPKDDGGSMLRTPNPIPVMDRLIVWDYMDWDSPGDLRVRWEQAKAVADGLNLIPAIETIRDEALADIPYDSGNATANAIGALLGKALGDQNAAR